MQCSATLALVLAVSFGLVSAGPNVARQQTGPGAPCGSGRGLECNDDGQCVTTDGFNSVQAGIFPECANSAEGREAAQAAQDASDAREQAVDEAEEQAAQNEGVLCNDGDGTCDDSGNCLTNDGFNTALNGNFPECTG